MRGAASAGLWYHGRMDTLTNEQIRVALQPLDGWEYDDGALRRDFRFDSFRDAITFIDRVADLAESADHHPEITNVYDRVTLVLTSHDAGGVTERDLELAGAIDAVA